MLHRMPPLFHMNLPTSSRRYSLPQTLCRCHLLPSHTRRLQTHWRSGLPLSFGRFALLACVFMHSTRTFIRLQYPPTILTSFTGVIPSSSTPLHHRHLTWPTLSAPSCYPLYSSPPLFFWVSGTSSIYRF